eukprot:1394252-Amorphochlora_amoeboformis.AAC.2
MKRAVRLGCHRDPHKGRNVGWVAPEIVTREEIRIVAWVALEIVTMERVTTFFQLGLVTTDKRQLQGKEYQHSFSYGGLLQRQLQGKECQHSFS